jgi:hypothetical protein
MVFQILGLISGLIFFTVGFPYLFDTLRGKTRPHRVTWAIAVTLNLIGFANQFASGATNSLWMFGAATAMSIAIFTATLVKGVGGHSRLDIFTLTFAFAGIALWVHYDDPLFSIIANTFVAVVALVPTYLKARRDPASETRILWLGGTVGAALGALSVGKWDVQLLIIPVSGVLTQGLMAYTLYRARPTRGRR